MVQCGCQDSLHEESCIGQPVDCRNDGDCTDDESCLSGARVRFCAAGCVTDLDCPVDYTCCVSQVIQGELFCLPLGHDWVNGCF